LKSLSDSKRKLFTHIALHVEDLESCILFYQRYCNLNLIHDRISGASRVVWLSENGKEKEFIIVMMSGGKRQSMGEKNYSHLGFAVSSKEEVYQIAEEAKQEGILFWQVYEEPYPVGTYCGVLDPNGNIIEFSFGQPLGEF
jgi:catechol 2,3-dioxygenase-like lactoylglutathione lyase family enzyme